MTLPEENIAKAKERMKQHVEPINTSKQHVEETGNNRHIEPVAWITKSCQCYSTPLKAMEYGNKEELIPVYIKPQAKDNCPSCEYHKGSGTIWRDFAKQQQAEIETLKAALKKASEK